MPYADYEIHKKHARDYYWNHKKEILVKRQEHYQENRERLDKAHKKWSKNNPEKHSLYSRKSVKKWISKNKKKTKCHREVRKAIARGDLIRPKKCNNCGLNRVIHAHHHDYSKPLCVKWLCRKCHMEVHKK